jgi:hypothetical protein
MNSTAEPLRAWAKGCYPLEAAVELLVRAFDGRFASPGCPWICATSDEDGWWVDATAITEDAIGYASSGERKLLLIAASLAGGDPVQLDDVIPGLDRGLIQLVLAAISHTGGCHEHADIRIDHTRRVSILAGRLPALVPWPGGNDHVRERADLG